MTIDDCIADALDIESAWEVRPEDFAQVVADLAMTDIELSGLDDFASPYTPLQF
jgi:hypothetical protein